MKRIIAIILSAIMLLGVMSVVAFAEEEILPWELEDWGQQSWTLYLNDKDSPKIDGKIEDGEYALAIEDLEVANNDADDRFFTVDFPADLEMDIYMDYDGDFLYIGVILMDPHSGIVGGKSPDDRLYVRIGGNKESIMIPDAIGVTVDVGATTATGADQVKTSVDGNVITYEFSIDRYTIMDKYGFDELDQVYLQMIVIDITEENLNPENKFDNELWFGFTTRDLVDILPAHTSGNNRFRYPHVIYFVDEPKETEAPETDAPVTEAPETEAPVTEAPATDAPETEAPAAEGGCGASVAAVGVALVAALGTCTVFVSKKR